jgi:hypothetical protein
MARIATSAMTRLYAESANSGMNAVRGQSLAHSFTTECGAGVQLQCLPTCPSRQECSASKKSTLDEKRDAARSLQMVSDLAAGSLGLIYSQQRFGILNWFLIENMSAGDHCSN